MISIMINNVFNNVSIKRLSDIGIRHVLYAADKRTNKRLRLKNIRNGVSLGFANTATKNIFLTLVRLPALGLRQNRIKSKFSNLKYSVSSLSDFTVHDDT